MKFILLFISVSVTGLLWSQNTLTLHTASAEVTIEKEIYGHFSEHLGTCIYEGIYVGDHAEIPNINGYRTDVVEALKALKVPVNLCQFLITIFYHKRI